jgi:hypothetical protein
MVVLTVVGSKQGGSEAPSVIMLACVAPFWPLNGDFPYNSPQNLRRTGRQTDWDSRNLILEIVFQSLTK